MEITSEKLFSLIQKKMSKKRKEKEEKNKKTLITENDFQILTYGIIFNNSYISKITFNSIEKNILYNFENLEYLSLTNNSIRNIDFIKHFPNLYYLDLYNNLIDDFSSLNKKNIFGYIRLSIDHFNEKKILQIQGLTAIMFEINLRDNQILKGLIYNNPNILMLNYRINYIIDKIISKEQSRRALKRMQTQLIMRLPTDLISSDNITNTKHNSVSNLKIHNPILIKIKEFYDNYTKQIENLLNIQKVNTSSLLKENKDYLNIEKNKLILLYENYIEITKLNNNIKYYYINNTDNIYENEKINKIRIYSITKKLENGKNEEIKFRIGIILLINYLFVSLNLISKNMFIIVINFILEKYTNTKFEDLISKDTNLESIFLISIYFHTYDIFIYLFKDIKTNKFYDNIVKILSMDKLILKANILFDNIHRTENKGNNFSNKKNLINHKLNFINQIDIFEEIIILIQFFYDYILYDKLDKIFLNSDISNEYITFIEFKEIIQQEGLEKNNIISISDHKYKKTQLDNLNIQFYLDQEKNKILRNKLFLPKSKRRKILKTYYNYDNDYKSKNDIEVEYMLKVRRVEIINKTFNQTNSYLKNRTEVNLGFNIPKIKYDKYYNRTSRNFKTIQNKNNDSFKEDSQYNLLKSIINNNELLLQKSRILLKEEKIRKKLYKKKVGEKIEKIIQTNKSDNNGSLNSISAFSSNNNQNTINSNHLTHLDKKISSFEKENSNNQFFTPFNNKTPNNKQLKEYLDTNKSFNNISYSREDKSRKVSKYSLNKKIYAPVKLISSNLETVLKNENND